MKFRMVDRILEWEPRSTIRGVKAVSFEEYELKEALGDEPRLPECLAIEALFQLGNWLVILSTDYGQMALVVAVRGGPISRSAPPGRPIADGGRGTQLARRRPHHRRDHRRRPADDRRGDRCLASVPLADYQDPDDLRVLFLEIYRPGSGPRRPGEAVHAPFGTARLHLLHHGSRFVPPVPHGGAGAGLLSRRPGLAAEPLPLRVRRSRPWSRRTAMVPVRGGPGRCPTARRWSGRKPPRLGCPHDCGPCTWHASPCQLPVLSITNACNLRCPICFTYNRDDRHLAHAGRGDAAHRRVDRRRARGGST